MDPLTTLNVPPEPLPIKLARPIVGLLPFGRATALRTIAARFGCPREFLAKCGDLQIAVHIDDIVSVTLYNYGCFEPAIAALFEQLVEPGTVVLDVGANFGYYTLLAARRCGSTGRTLAFEPDPRNLRRLNINLQANGVSNVTVVPLGVSDHSGTADFFLASPSAHNLGTSSLVSGDQSQERVQIELTTLDEIIRQNRIERVGLLKMDIEGAEYEALGGAARSIGERRIDRVVLELHTEILGEEKSRAVLGIFSQNGYRGWRINEHAKVPRGSPAPLIPLGEAVEPGVWGRNPHIVFCAPGLAVPAT